MATLEEIVVPDIHNNWKFYEMINKVAKSTTKRVILVGDLREEIDQQRLKSFIDPASIKEGKIALDDPAIVTAFAKESEHDYAQHEKHIKKILEKHSHLKFYGVPGNHDTIFLPDQTPSVDWLLYSQSLRDEKVAGAFVCSPEEGSMHPQWNGPGLVYGPLPPGAYDDDVKDATKSKLYTGWHGKPLDLIVTHCGPALGSAHGEKGRSYPTGAGITKLAQETGCIVYEGHLHGGVIYRDAKSGALIIRPGVHHIAEVHRDGKNAKKITLYRVN